MFTAILALTASAVMAFVAYFVARVHFNTKRVKTQDDMFSRSAAKTREELKQTGDAIGFTAYYVLVYVIPIALFIVGCYFYGLLLGIVLAVIGLFIPNIILSLLKSAHQGQFEKNFLQSLDQISASLRAGASVMQAIDDVVNCKFLSTSLRRQYAVLSNNIHMGTPIPEAFELFAEETGNMDAKDFALAIKMQGISGGKEADATKQIADNIKTRIETNREVKNIFSSERYMVWVMDFVLPGIIVFFLFSNQEYISFYFESPLMTMVFFLFFACSLIGSLINHRMIKRLQEG